MSGQYSPTEERMQVAMEELGDLRGVWSELARIWEQIDDLKEKPWLSVQPRKVRTRIRSVIVHGTPCRSDVRTGERRAAVTCALGTSRVGCVIAAAVTGRPEQSAERASGTTASVRLVRVRQALSADVQQGQSAGD